MLIRKIAQQTIGAAFLGLAGLAYGAAGVAVPPSLAAEHTQLHEELARALKVGGRTAAEARKVEKLLQAHFRKEEQFALPPLAVLADLASGKLPPNAAEIIGMSTALQDQMPAMLAEHEAIGKALERLHAAAREEHRQEAASFAEHLKAHARQEEEIHYPAAILAGQYLKLKQR